MQVVDKKTDCARILVVAQLALGDSQILKTQFLRRLSKNFLVTVLCNDYNKFIFNDYDRAIENWPIAFNRPFKMPVDSRKIRSDDYQQIILPSAHLRELVFARIRFDNGKLLIPKGKNFRAMQKNGCRLSFLGLNCISLNSSAWYPMYRDFAYCVNDLWRAPAPDYDSAISVQNFIRIEKERPFILAPHSNRSARYKWIPDDLLNALMTELARRRIPTVYISEYFSSRLSSFENVETMSPNDAVQKFEDAIFTAGLFCDSFLSHFFSPRVRQHFVYDSGVDRYHANAIPENATLISRHEIEKLFDYL